MYSTYTRMTPVSPKTTRLKAVDDGTTPRTKNSVSAKLRRATGSRRAGARPVLITRTMRSRPARTTRLQCSNACIKSTRPPSVNSLVSDAGLPPVRKPIEPRRCGQLLLAGPVRVDHKQLELPPSPHPPVEHDL